MTHTDLEDCDECDEKQARIRELEAELRRCNPILAAAQAARSIRRTRRHD